jgi:hypothetical protein
MGVAEARSIVSEEKKEAIAPEVKEALDLEFSRIVATAEIEQLIEERLDGRDSFRVELPEPQPPDAPLPDAPDNRFGRISLNPHSDVT